MHLFAKEQHKVDAAYITKAKPFATNIVVVVIKADNSIAEARIVKVVATKKGDSQNVACTHCNHVRHSILLMLNKAVASNHMALVIGAAAFHRSPFGFEFLGHHLLFHCQ